jgi:CheY-like chemotaxis protein
LATIKAKILVIDDEEDFLSLSEKFLKMEYPNFKITKTLSGKNALELLRQKKFDVIVSDYQMPEMDGLTVLNFIRSDFLLINNTTPFIIFTGKGREEVVIKAMNLGADYYVVKGDDLASQYVQLSSIIKKSLELSDLKTENVKTLEQQVEFFHSIFQRNPDPSILWEYQSDGQIILKDFNSASIKYSKGSISDFKGNSLENFYEDDPDVYIKVREILESDKWITERYDKVRKLTTTGEIRTGGFDIVRVSDNIVMTIANDTTYFTKIIHGLEKDLTEYHTMLDKTKVNLLAYKDNIKSTINDDSHIIEKLDKIIEDLNRFLIK